MGTSGDMETRTPGAWLWFIRRRRTDGGEGLTFLYGEV